VGASRDRAFGPSVLVGLGGISAEVLGDVALRLAPLEAACQRGPSLQPRHHRRARQIVALRGRPDSKADIAAQARRSLA